MAGGPPLGQQPPGGLSPGDQVLVFYDDPTEQQWHARLLLSCITGDEWIILTPDGDIYGEQISSGNPDFLAWRPMDPNNVIPVGINRAQVYGFRVFPDPAALARLTDEGQGHAAQERVRRGLAGGVQGGGGGPAGQIAPLAGGQPAVAAQPGAAVAVPNVAGNPAPQGGVPAAGGLAGLVQALGPNQGQNGGSDARTLPISRDVEGMRFKEFREAATISQPVPFEDWPIAGPRTVKHVLSAMLDSGGSALAHHQAWRTACRFQPTDGPAMEHESWCRVLHVMATYDQLDTTNLASAELIARAIQRIEEKHKMKLAAVDDAGESAFFMGAAGGSRVGSVVSPKLTEWVGSEMHKEAAVAKERRKAREERTLARKGDKKEDK